MILDGRFHLFYFNPFFHLESTFIMGGSNLCVCVCEEGGAGCPDPHLENHKWLLVSLKIQVRTPLEKQLDPSGPLLLEGGSYSPL